VLCSFIVYSLYPSSFMSVTITHAVISTALIRSIIALHDLISNKIKYMNIEGDGVQAKPAIEDKKEDEVKKEKTTSAKS